ncbi:MAG: electron transport complex subunit RsxC [Desulfatitalea sp.]|nr:electron transport complex subunit RsxC [Desulfatitalea sp.]NNJ98861.1 electron transport complex subunit RsxC [Desulfatitalea sp.]
MRRFWLKDFPGKGSFPHGIHPPYNKEMAMDAPIEVMPPPKRVVLPLLQNIGAPCEAVVKPKQEVAWGETIGLGKAFISANLHSPVSGVVEKIGVSTLPNGRHLPAINIRAEGEQVTGQALYEDVLGGHWPKDCPAIYYPATIAKAVHESGIVGLGGAAFPTHVKVRPYDTKMIDTLMINGCECEPYLTTDYRLMVEAPKPVISGALYAARAVAAQEVIICVEDNKPEAIKQLRMAAGHTVVKIAVLKTKYPQGSEKQLIKAVLDLEVPLGGLPADVGVAMSNVATIAAIARGVIREKPLTHRVISVTGAGIVRPKNLLVPIGISMAEVIDYCGGLTRDAARIVAGGPMMGFAFSNLTTPVTKGTSGLTVLTHDDVRAENETHCVRCGRCVDVCPMHLVPTKLAMASRYGNVAVAQQYNITACFECGCCTYACPARIKLVQLIRMGKIMVIARSKN